MKTLGKIESARFGIGGYNDSMIGIFVTLTSDSFGTGDSRCAWDANLVECSKHSKWTENDRSEQYDEILRYISDLLHKAKVSDVSKLAGKPVEITTEGNQLTEWRILTEVL